MPVADVPARIAELFGPSPLPRDAGIVHVTALGRWGTTQVVTMAINEHTPRSELDAFSLNLARARADIILTTGQILRDEPSLTYDLFVREPWVRALLDWRREILQRPEPPEVWVLTSGRDLDLDHPGFHSWARARIITGPEAVAHLEGPARERGIALTGLVRAQPRTVVQEARDRGARTVVIEAGPRTTAALYEAPGLVDELQLSIYEGHLDPEAIVGGPRSLSELTTALPHSSGTRRFGSWTFERRTR